MAAIAKILPVIASLVFIGSKISDSYTKNLWHNLKFSIPLDKVKVGFKNLFEFYVIAALKIENHYYLAIDLTSVHMSVFYVNKQGTLSELGSTPPSSRQWTINSNATSLLNNIELNIKTASVFPAIKAMLRLPEGKRFKIVISGYVNSLPFSQEIWY